MSYDPSILSNKVYIQSQMSSPTDPAGTTSTTLVMMGLAITYTPTTTGRLKITLSGLLSQNTTADGAAYQISYGTGTSPTNGAAVTGTQIGTQGTMTFLTGLLTVPTSKTVIVTGLVRSTTYWIDVALKAVTGGTATITKLDITIEEF